MKKYRSKEKQIKILEILYENRGKSVRWKTIRDVLRKEFKCGDSSIKYNLDELIREGFAEKVGRGEYKITSDGIREYLRRNPVEYIPLDDSDINLIKVSRDSKEVFSHECIISGYFERELDEKFYEWIEMKKDKYIEAVYFDTNVGINTIFIVYPEEKTFRIICLMNSFDAFPAEIIKSITDMGAEFVWKILLLKANEFLFYLNAFTDNSLKISEIILLDLRNDRGFVSNYVKSWNEFFNEIMQMPSKLKAFDISPIIVRDKIQDKRIKELLKKFKEKIEKTLEEKDAVIEFRFLSHEAYLNFFGLMFKEHEERYIDFFIIIHYEDAKRIFMDIDRLKRHSDEVVLFKLAEAVFRCIFPNASKKEIFEKISEFLEREFNIGKEALKKKIK